MANEPGIRPTNRFMGICDPTIKIDGGAEIKLNGCKGISHRVSPDGRLLAGLTLLDVAQAVSLSVGTVFILTARLRDAYHAREFGVDVCFGRYRVTRPPVIDAGHRKIDAATVQLESLDRERANLGGVPGDFGR